MLSVKYTIYRDDNSVLYSQRIKMDGGSQILCRYDEADIYPMLGEVTTWDAETFFFSDMDGLITELLNVRETLTKPFDIEYLDDIVRLCQKCKANKKGQIVFNPLVDIIDLTPAKT